MFGIYFLKTLLNTAMHTKFELITSVDITNHVRASREDKLTYGQKQNYLTVINTIGLRANPTIEEDPIVTRHEAFGNNDAWKLNFIIEAEGAVNIEMLEQDFMFVPFITGLNETQTFEEAVFITSGDKTNILFDTLNDK